MELFKKETNINFMGMRKYTTTISLLVCIASIICLFTKGLHFGLEFTGGTQIELRFRESIQTSETKQILEKNNFVVDRIQHYGSPMDLLIRIDNVLQDSEKLIRDQVCAAFAAEGKVAQVRRVEYVGSEVGQQLAEQGAIAVLVAILATMIYIALRFEYRFAVTAAIGLMHDALIVLGIFSLLQIEFDLAALAAVLAVVGYSLNDTIVVFDRVRENFRVIRQGTVQHIINVSLNQTLSRTLMTSWLTLMVVLALLFFGGESLFSFSLVLCLGIIIGTYSSIYVAGSLAINFGLSRADLLPRPKAAIDDRP